MNYYKPLYITILIGVMLVIIISPLLVNSLYSRYLLHKYSQNNQHSCVVTIEQPTLIIRLDDVRAYSNSTYKIVNYILSKNMTVVLGVIPSNLVDDKQMVNYLHSLIFNSNVEIAVHGYAHIQEESNITDNGFEKGKQIISQYVGVEPVTYIPPYNYIDIDAYNRSSKYFNIISSNKELLKEGKIASIGQVEEAMNYNNLSNIYFNDINLIIDKCKKELKDINICVITMHPQEFNDNDGYIQIIDSLSNLNVSHKTFHDLVYCGGNENEK